MPLKLELRVPGMPIRVFESGEASITLGRGSGNVVALENPHVSTYHGRIDVGPSGLMFTDLGSTNGSMIIRGDKRMPAPGGGPAVPLQVGDRLVMGDSAEPVHAMLLDDGRGGAVHPSRDETLATATAVAAKPVDPDSGGEVRARFAVDTLGQLPEQISKEPRLASAMFELARSVTVEDLDAVVDRAGQVLFSVCPMASHLFAGVLEKDENEFRRTFFRARGRQGEQPPWRVSRALLARCITRREAVLVADAPLEISGETVKLEKIRSAICLPLWRAGEVWGVLAVDTREGGVPFTEKDLEMVTVLSSMVTLALVNADLQGRIRARGEALESENRYLHEALRRAGRFSDIIGRSSAMTRVFEQLAKVARTDATVLIEGETGTGKELVARAVHNQSPRKERIFLGQNCGALTDNLLESELFGHVRGAFTGATSDKKGLFTVADEGTIFLDEIGETTAAMQQRLLRVLQEGEVRPVGSTRSHKVNVRVVAATNRDLEAEVKEGRFREDLLYRLKVVPIRLPPLRERGEDIPLLAEHFIHVYAAELERGTLRLTADTMAALRAYAWPGNIRELQNEMQRVAIQADADQEIQPADLSAKITGAPRLKPTVASDQGTLKELMDAVEAQVLRDRLASTSDNVTRAAETLGLTREGLHKKLKRFGLR